MASRALLAEDPASRDLAATALFLARRFSLGGRLWCVSPTWPSHAHHLAVEFVHPVIVGKRALPATAVTSIDAAHVLRTASRPGDVLASVAGADDPTVGDLMHRAPAWGVDTIWIGCGQRPAPGTADHVVWVDDDQPLVPYSGELVLRYHLLWELTHVCFEHPGLLRQEPGDDAEVCITCSDEGRVAEVIGSATGGETRVRTGNGEERVDTTLVGEVEAGDLVLVHAGTVIARVEAFGGP